MISTSGIKFWVILTLEQLLNSHLEILYLDFLIKSSSRTGKAHKQSHKFDHLHLSDTYGDQTIMVGEQWGSDQKGPITPTSQHGANYFIIFIDYFSSYIIHFFLPSLDLTYKAYCNLRAIVSTHLHKKI